MKRDFFYAIIIFCSQVYFSFTALFNIQTGGEGTAGTAYVVYCTILFMLGVVNFFWDISKLWSSNAKFLLPLVILFIYIISGISAGLTASPYFLCLGAFSLPATLAAIIFGSRNSLSSLVKWLDVFFLFFAISLPFIVSRMYAVIMSGYTQYDQSLSYMTANCFLIDIFLLTFGNRYNRFKFTQKRIYKWFSITMIPVCIFINLFAGGRGAFLVIMVGFIYVLFHIKATKILTYLLSVVTVSYILFALFSSKSDTSVKNVFERNSGRVVAYISNEGIDMSETSGRDGIYEKAIFQISERPVLGYGIYNYLVENHNMNPHNFFLEILLQGGIIFLLLFIFILFRFVCKLRYIIKLDSRQVMIMPFVLYSFTELMFSGSYMANAYFWFALTYVYMFDSRKAFNSQLR